MIKIHIIFTNEAKQSEILQKCKMHGKITGIFMHTVGDAEINVSMFDTNLLAKFVLCCWN